ncbi:MAG TPA: hypothetical protein VK842_07680 [bacterium]|nr:hypothetical protein [bacterium]
MKAALALLLCLAWGAPAAGLADPGAPTSTFPSAESFHGAGPALSPSAQALPVSASVQALPVSPGAQASPASPTARGLSGTALALSPPADVLAEMAPRPSPPEHRANARWEDFTAVTLLSAPFTAFWSVLGAVLVSTVSQSREHGRLAAPSMGTPELTSAAMIAGAASVSIGLVSVQWGGSPRGESGTAAPLPYATPTKAVP